MKPQLIPSNISRLMSEKDKQELGVIPQGKLVEIKLEKELQKLCEQELSRRNIEYLHLSPMAREKKGWPDLAFCFPLITRNSFSGNAGIPYPVACELKGPDGKLSSDQERILANMQSDGWHVFVCRTFDEFLGIFTGQMNEWHP